MNFVKIPAGKFTVGSPKSDPGRWNDETQREVEIAEFEIMDTPVLEVDWERWKDPGCARNKENIPKANVSWDGVQTAIAGLNEVQAEYTYRLPTEEEWEYACRAGTTTAYSFGDDPKDLGKYAWFYENSEGRIHPVKQKLPNGWGLYDMHGNVWEWTSSLYQKTGSYRVIRGGGWCSSARRARSAFRSSLGPSYRHSYVGFRLVRTLRSALLPLDPLRGEAASAARRAEAMSHLKIITTEIKKIRKILS